MKYFDWDELKNDLLRNELEVCFEDVVVAISSGGLLDILTHPNPNRYPSQSVYVVRLEDYVYIVPFVEDETKIFLKTIYPSRKLTKLYLKGEL